VPVAAPPPAPSAAASAWRADASARDLGTRLASQGESAPEAEASRGGLLKQLVRGIGRTLRG
jgi:hypothetical protein